MKKIRRPQLLPLEVTQIAEEVENAVDTIHLQSLIADMLQTTHILSPSARRKKMNVFEMHLGFERTSMLREPPLIASFKRESEKNASQKLRSSKNLKKKQNEKDFARKSERNEKSLEKERSGVALVLESAEADLRPAAGRLHLLLGLIRQVHPRPTVATRLAAILAPEVAREVEDVVGVASDQSAAPEADPIPVVAAVPIPEAQRMSLARERVESAENGPDPDLILAPDLDLNPQTERKAVRNKTRVTKFLRGRI